MVYSANDELDERVRLGRALKTLRVRAGLSQEQAAIAFAQAADPHGEDDGSFTKQAWGLYETGKRKGIHKPDVQGALAAAVGASREDLLIEADRHLAGSSGAQRTRLNPFTPNVVGFPGGEATLFIRDRVMAGTWRAADDSGQAPPRRWPAAPDPRYAHAPQWLSEVEGDSMDKLNIFDGDLCQVVDAYAIGYHPQKDDIVEVERLRLDGSERELTIKQIEFSPSGEVQLWPRSTNPRWQTPLPLVDPDEKDQTIETRIRGVVRGLIRRL